MRYNENHNNWLIVIIIAYNPCSNAQNYDQIADTVAVVVVVDVVVLTFHHIISTIVGANIFIGLFASVTQDETAN